MTKNEQIEEMAKVICKPTANKGNCDKCGFKKQCSKFDDATDLYNAGYRKVERGEWIYDAENECFTCSICENSALNNYRTLSVNSDFCPHCGADMRGEGK